MGGEAERGERAWAFDVARDHGLATRSRRGAQATGIRTIALGGGVLHNRLLKSRLAFYLADFTLLFPERLPAGDGAIALGQGVIAAAWASTAL